MFCEFSQAEVSQGKTSNLNLHLTSVLKILCAHRDIHTNPALASWPNPEILKWPGELECVCKVVHYRCVDLCVHMHVCVFIFFFFFSLSTHHATREEALERKEHILPLWGIDCKFWLFNLWGCLWRFTATSILFPCAAIFPLWDKHHPQQPLLPTPLLLCGCAAGCTTPGLLGPAQQPPQVGFLSTSSLLSTYAHSIVCDLTEQKV